jgi:hypothetical protein
MVTFLGLRPPPRPSFGLILCGLNKHLIKGSIHVAALAVLNGQRIGRESAWVTCKKHVAQASPLSAPTFKIAAQCILSRPWC